jgi:hypothetical protein
MIIIIIRVNDMLCLIKIKILSIFSSIFLSGDKVQIGSSWDIAKNFIALIKKLDNNPKIKRKIFFTPNM